MHEEGTEDDETMIAAEATSVSLPFLDRQLPFVSDKSLICYHRREDGSTEIAVASGTSVFVCHESGALERRYSVDFTVNQILWATFPRTKDDKESEGPLECFVVVGSQAIAFFLTDDGHPYSYQVPFKVRKVHQTSFGLFVEQFWRSDEEYRMRHNEYIYLYSLTHPLTELLPVLYRPRDFIGRWLFCWEREEVTIVNCFEDCVLVFDRVIGVHRLYQIKKAANENLKTALFLQDDSVGVVHSTPKTMGLSSKGHTPASSRITPKTTLLDVQPAVPLSLSVRTRSMMRLARTRTFPMDSPAFSSFGTPLSNISYDSPSFRLRSSSLHSTLGTNITRILERDPNNDLCYADFCLDPIWHDSGRRDPHGIIADKSFLTRSLSKQLFVNIFVRENKILRCFRLSDSDGTKSVIGNSHGSLSCLDATYLESDSSTVVLEAENSLVLYSGLTKVALISFAVPPSRTITSLLPAAGFSFVSVLNDGNLCQISIRPLYEDHLVESLFSTLLGAITPQEKAVKLISDWRCFNPAEEVIPSYQKPPLCAQVLTAFRFILQEIGITVNAQPKFVEEDNDENVEDMRKQRRPRQSQEESWQRLNSFGKVRQNSISEDSSAELLVDTSAPLFPCFTTVFAAIHSVWQEWSLDKNIVLVRKQCVDFLRCCATVMSNNGLLAVYESEFPDSGKVKYTVKPNGELYFAKNMYIDNAFSISGVLEEMLKMRYTGQIYTYSTKISRLFLATAVGLGTMTNMVDVHRLFGKRFGARIGISTDELEKVIFNKRITPSEKCAKLLLLFGYTSATIQNLPGVIGILLVQIIRQKQRAIDNLFPKTEIDDSEFPSSTEVSRVALLRWPTDIRMDNARNMLNSSRPVLINTQVLTSQSTTDDTRDLQEVFLSGTCIRYLAQSFGRAMFEFRSLSSYPTANELVPELCLTARLFPNNMSYEITASESNRPYREWGEFYNGVASALRLGHASLVTVDSEWLVSVCCKNDKLSMATSSGFLYGFALNGHILASTYHVSEMLISLDEFQSVALLLGYATGKLGSGDLRVYKMLSTQLPFLMGPTTLSISIPSINQTAAVASLGLLFAATGNTTLVKKLLNEIGKSLAPDEAPANDRFAYRLNAGFSIGLICIGLGDELMDREPPFVQPQPNIIDRLSTMMNGGPRSMCVFPASNGFSQEGENHVNNQTVSCHVQEGGNVNVHLTGHPACIALGLMFLRTNNEHIANRLSLPDSIKQLEAIRPDIIMVRTLCKNLVMWDSMEATEDWVEAQVPRIIMKYLKAALKWKEDEDIVIPPNGSEDRYWDQVIDRETVAQVYLYTVTGACMALALKFMSAYESQKSMAHGVIEHFASILLPSSTKPTHKRLAHYAGHNVTSLCLNSLLTSLALVVAASGHMNTLRIARLWRINEHILSWMRSIRKHQEQLVAHQVIGLLFMGNARYAFKNDNLSIALLVIAFYPLVCHGVTDNKFFHQPLRFMWTQAVEPRLLIPTAKKGGQPMNVPIKVWYKNEKNVLCNDGPTMLPPLDEINCVEVGGGDYELVRFDFTNSDTGRKELENILTRKHGRLRISETANFGVTTTSLNEQIPQFNLSSVLNGNMTEYAKEFTPLPSVQTKAVNWPDLELIGSAKEHMRSLQKVLEESAEFGKILPDVQLARQVALWGNEPSLGWSLELEMDRLQIDPERARGRNGAMIA